MKQDVCPTCGRGKPGRRANPKRDAAITRQIQRGRKAEQVAAEFGLSVTRVREIAKAALQ